MRRGPHAVVLTNLDVSSFRSFKPVRVASWRRISRLSDEEVLLKSCLFFVLKCSEDFRFFPVDRSVNAFGSVFCEARYVHFWVFSVGCDIVTMLFLPFTYFYTRFSHINSFQRAGASLALNSFLFEFRWFRLVLAAEKVAQFRGSTESSVAIVFCEDAF